MLATPDRGEARKLTDHAAGHARHLPFRGVECAATELLAQVLQRDAAGREGAAEPGDALQVVDRGAHDVDRRVGVVDPVHRHLVDAQPGAFGEDEQLGVEEPAGVLDERHEPLRDVAADGLEAALRIGEPGGERAAQDEVVGARDELALGPAHDAGVAGQPRADRQVGVPRDQRGDQRQEGGEIGRQVHVAVGQHLRVGRRPRRPQRPAAALLRHPQRLDLGELGGEAGGDRGRGVDARVVGDRDPERVGELGGQVRVEATDRRLQVGLLVVDGHDHVEDRTRAGPDHRIDARSASCARGVRRGVDAHGDNDVGARCRVLVVDLCVGCGCDRAAHDALSRSGEVVQGCPADRRRGVVLLHPTGDRGGGLAAAALCPVGSRSTDEPVDLLRRDELLELRERRGGVGAVEPADRHHRLPGRELVARGGVGADRRRGPGEVARVALQERHDLRGGRRAPQQAAEAARPTPAAAARAPPHRPAPLPAAPPVALLLRPRRAAARALPPAWRRCRRAPPARCPPRHRGSRATLPAPPTPLQAGGPARSRPDRTHPAPSRPTAPPTGSRPCAASRRWPARSRSARRAPRPRRRPRSPRRAPAARGGPPAAPPPRPRRAPAPSTPTTAATTTCVAAARTPTPRSPRRRPPAGAGPRAASGPATRPPRRARRAPRSAAPAPRRSTGG